MLREVLSGKTRLGFVKSIQAVNRSKAMSVGANQHGAMSTLSQVYYHCPPGLCHLPKQLTALLTKLLHVQLQLVFPSTAY